MFSNNSFNALLKTLEEPPPHVKFLLATTDPQKVPVTVLSRCLQLNLRRLLPEEIRERLGFVLETEGLAFESGALALLARAADGSMRDGLSLLDQAIAYGAGRVAETDVRAMLGTVGADLTFGLVEALAAADGARLLAEVERTSAYTPDFGEVLRELIGLLHRLALFQQVPETVPMDDPERTRIASLAGRIVAADLQLYYQVALTGQTDLALAPDPRSGLEMVLLRALAFRPAEGTEVGERMSPMPAIRPGHGPVPPDKMVPLVEDAAGAGRSSLAGVSTTREIKRPIRGGDREAESKLKARLTNTADWHQLVNRLGVGGIASQLAHHCGFIALGDGRLVLSLDPGAEQLRSPGTEERLRGALEAALGGPLRLEIRITRPQQETPAQRRGREEAVRAQAAQDTLASDPVGRRLQDQFDGQWVPGSIEPLD
jgi:DNA polymerase-3 subunit gamma/tau